MGAIREGELRPVEKGRQGEQVRSADAGDEITARLEAAGFAVASEASGEEAGESGLYILWLRLPRAVRVRVGRLGEAAFPPGLYAYVGSAQRNRGARIRRHLRVEKPLRWHIDYLRPYGEVVGVTYVEGRREDECRLVAAVCDSLPGERVFPGFGASDCRCGGHLVRVRGRLSGLVSYGSL